MLAHSKTMQMCTYLTISEKNKLTKVLGEIVKYDRNICAMH